MKSNDRLTRKLEQIKNLIAFLNNKFLSNLMLPLAQQRGRARPRCSCCTAMPQILPGKTGFIHLGKNVLQSNGAFTMH